MNYYERYCGDYARKTAGLSLQEHGAYTLMLDNYYANEAPLPVAYDDLYRICRAMKASERESVRSVADKYFPVADDGLRHNEKADEVIAKARKRIAAARANGVKLRESTGTPTGTPSGVSDGVASGPIGTTTRPQTPLKDKSKTLSAAADGVFARFWSAYPRKTAASRAKEAFKRINPDDALLASMLSALSTQKTTEQWLRGVIPHAATWLNQRRWDDEVKPAGANGAASGAERDRQCTNFRGDDRCSNPATFYSKVGTHGRCRECGPV